MKKKIKIIVCIILIIVLLFVACGCAVLGIMHHKNLFPTTGQYLLTDTGANMIINENGSPIKMSNVKGKEGLFDGLTNGDKIVVINDFINETYPASTGVYAVFKLEDGEFEDLPEETIDNLTEMNWLIGEGNTIIGENVEISGYGKTISITIPEGWEYARVDVANAYIEYGDNPVPEYMGVCIYPKGYNQGNSLTFAYNTQFGVCGTGLTETDVTVAGLPAKMGTYDDDTMWQFISFDLEHYVWNYGADVWWEDYGDEAMKILDTIEYS